MTSTGAALAGGALPTTRRCSPAPAPVFSLPQRTPPPRALLELLRKVDARAPAALPGETKSDHFHAVATCGERFQRARCGCGRRLLPRTCGDRLCPHCEKRRAARAVESYGPCFDGQPAITHLVFTMKRAPLGELEESIDFMNGSLRKFRHSKIGKELLRGGTTSLETKGNPPARDDRGGWHTHAHVLAWGRFVPIAAAALRWIECTGGRVDWRKFFALPSSVRRANKGSGHLKALLSTAEQDPLGCVETHGRGRVVHIAACPRDFDGSYKSSLREALKYVTKSPIGAKDGEEAAAGWTVDMAEEFYRATKDRRLFNKFGNCPKIAELEPVPCSRCGEPVELCHGHFAHALTREDAEKWAAQLEPGEVEHGLYAVTWTLEDERDWADRVARFNGGPGP